MIDITHKSASLRVAEATASVMVSSQETIRTVQNKAVPKGDVIEFSRAAGLLAIKQTQHVIPDCHPLPIEGASFQYELLDDRINIVCKVSTIYKTGVEVEAMHGAMIAALTIYDMLKPIDKSIQITDVKLLAKKGGKSDFMDEELLPIKVAVVVCSDSISAGKKEDKSGKKIIESLNKFNVKTDRFLIISDESTEIKNTFLMLKSEGFNMVIYTGGTGLSSRDNTPESLKPFLTREIPGIMETARSYGQQRMPYAMLSRGIAGMSDETLLITLPGSARGAKESMDALLPHLLHIFSVQKKKNPHKL